MARHGGHVLLDVNVTDAAGGLGAVIIVGGNVLDQADLLAVEDDSDPLAGAGFEVLAHGDHLLLVDISNDAITTNGESETSIFG